MENTQNVSADLKRAVFRVWKRNTEQALGAHVIFKIQAEDAPLALEALHILQASYQSAFGKESPAIRGLTTVLGLSDTFKVEMILDENATRVFAAAVEAACAVYFL